MEGYSDIMNLHWLWGVVGIFSLVILVLLIKLFLLRKAAKEIQEGFRDSLTADTNTLIDVSTGDKVMRSLAAAVNRELARLRTQRRLYQHADTELKSAITNISHDLRTPLTAIYAYLALLEQEEKSEAAGRYLEIIRGRADLLKTLTEELFQYSVLLSPKEDLHIEPLSLGEVLTESIASFYAPLKEHSITPDIHITGETVLRSLDRAALSRIFSNLLGNAVKYSRGDLEITLSESGEITFSNSAPNLDEIEIGRLFDRFYTVDSARKSTGLGLSIARTLVEQMNGKIWAESKSGRLAVHIRF